MTPDEKAELRKVAECPRSGLTIGAALAMLVKCKQVLALLDENARLVAEVERLKTWTNVGDALPDSDVSVVATNDHSEYVVVQLEFTDDSEGHGEPYWASDGGDFSLQRYRRWMPLPEPPK